MAARFSRRTAEAADLLHDALLDAIRAKRTDFSLDDTRRWFAGVLRNRAAMAARTAARRRRREAVPRSGDAEEAQEFSPPRGFVESLPPSARSLATLVVAGLSKREIT